ncbi:type II secretion system F family protein [Streptomyces sp. TP-A0874]|uniref:type II secretion system F family protein n=1 Tax=Streptomyces sp. TP-A0874 TaxID=549819 RepID=UPI000A4DFD96|nr:type II secretion system F family protein [Streptomyces sp. TP-A0874]
MGGDGGLWDAAGFASTGPGRWLDRCRWRRRARLLLTGTASDTEAHSLSPSTALPVGGWAEKAHRLRQGRWAAGWGREWLCAPAGVVLGLVSESVLPVGAGLAAVPLVRRWSRSREASRERERRGVAVVEFCGAVAGDLRAGRQPLEALCSAAAGLGPAAVPLTAAARFGGDVPRVLRETARVPGAEGLSGVAACWRISADGGAGLAAGLERVAASLRTERDRADELAAQLAGTRATGTMLAWLPAFALLMGAALGASPLRVLLHTPVGLACLLVGGLLEYAGLRWTSHIIRRAEALGSVTADG